MATDFQVGIGPTKIELILTHTVKSPTTTTSAAPVKAQAPLKHGRGAGASTTGVSDDSVLCANNDIPELIAIHRQELPSSPLGVMVVPRPVANDKGSHSMVVRLPYTGTPATGTDLQFLADGTGAYKIVAAAGGGIGDVISIDTTAKTFLAYL